MAEGGVLGGRELVSLEVLSAWTQRGFPDGDNRRGLVFDKPALEPDSGPTCDLASWERLATPDSLSNLGVDGPGVRFGVCVFEQQDLSRRNTALLRLDTRTEIQRVILEHLGASSRFADTP